VRAIEARRLVEFSADKVANGGFSKPNLDALGDDFGPAFDRSLVQLVNHLRRPSRT
jgi:hypothetical protein